MPRLRSLALALALAFAFFPFATPLAAQSCEDRGSDYAQRIALCDAALAAAQTPEDAAYALAMKGEAQRMLGDYAGAAETLRQALLQTPENAWVWVELGNVRYEEGDTAGALAHYSAALAVEDYIDAWANRADTWWQFGNGQRCSDDADNALRIDPQYAFANEVKGRCLTALGRAEEALTYFDTAIALSPGYQNAYRNKLAALASLGRHEEVVAVADEALRPEVVPTPNPVIEEDILSRRLLALGQFAPAETVAAEAEALLARYPDNLAAINVKGMALLRENRLEEADAATRTLRENPEGLRLEAAYLDTLAAIDVALGRFEAAVANYDAAMRIDPTLSRTYARKLSALGFLPLSNAPDGVLMALQRCLAVKASDCRMTP
jgi:tetratricopeptide (TPR) repeat protein